jgi:hypothetical protein
MQFEDLRVLLQLPTAAIAGDSGCNFTAGAMIFSLVSGFSVWFFHNSQGMRIAAKEAKQGRRISGARFKGFVRAYYPQVAGEPSKQLIATRLYEARNSLVHSLGIDEFEANERRKRIGLMKPDPAMKPTEISALETSRIYPGAGVPIRRQGLTTTVSIPGLYWAIGRMLRMALSDHPDRCEARAKDYLEVLPIPQRSA